MLNASHRQHLNDLSTVEMTEIIEIVQLLILKIQLNGGCGLRQFLSFWVL
jgi:hypothetical protein